VNIIRSRVVKAGRIEPFILLLHLPLGYIITIGEVEAGENVYEDLLKLYSIVLEVRRVEYCTYINLETLE
jgi:hypothetical protein